MPVPKSRETAKSTSGDSSPRVDRVQVTPRKLLESERFIKGGGAKGGGYPLEGVNIPLVAVEGKKSLVLHQLYFVQLRLTWSLAGEVG